jgi:hypothetical protein
MRQRGFSEKTVKYSGQEKELRGWGVTRKIQIRSRHNKTCGISRFPVNSHKIYIIYIFFFSERIFLLLIIYVWPDQFTTLVKYNFRILTEIL